MADKSKDKTHPLLYSIGHGNRGIETFMDLLQEFQIKHLADVRSYPSSRRNPHFNRESLELILNKAGIYYIWFTDLGGFRKTGLGSKSPHVALESPGFRNYADYMATKSFQAAVDRLILITNLGPVCYMCAETAPQMCHRSLLADHLLVMGFETVHILDKQRTISHQISPLATVVEGRLIYNRSEPQQLELKTND